MTKSPRLWATTFAVAIAAFSMPLTDAVASTAPTSTVPTSGATASGATTSTVPASTVPESDVGGPEIVQSWALSPASDDPNAGTRPNLTYSVSPGDVIEDEVTVFNFGNVPLNLNVYGVDAFNNVDGKFDIRPAADEPIDAGAWVKLDQNLVTVMPGKQITIPITITIPPDATPGDHVGAIVASSTEFGQSTDGQAIALDRRTGTRLYIRVAGTLSKEVRIGRVTAEYVHRVFEPVAAGSVRVNVRLENRGNTRIGGKVTLEVSGPFGLGEQRVVLDELDELLPGQKFDLETEVPGVRALLFGSATARFEPDPESTGGELAAVAGDDSFFAPPIGLLIVVLLAVVAVLVLRRRAGRFGAAAPGGASGR